MQRPDIGSGHQLDLLLEAQLCQPPGDFCFMINCGGLGHAVIVSVVDCHRYGEGMPSPDLGLPISALAAEGARLLVFGRQFPHPLGGAAWLDERGQPDLSKPVYTWISARMLHVYALGHLMGRPGDCDLAAEALHGLTGRLRDDTNGGGRPRAENGGESPDEKACYTHAFVVLAASSGAVAGLAGA